MDMKCKLMMTGMLILSSATVASAAPDRPMDRAKEFSGHYYALVDEGMTWPQAKQYCERMGGHLVTITSASEQAFVDDLLIKEGTKNSYWMGGFLGSDGAWQWITGESFSYTHWGWNQPDHDGNALMMYYSTANGWKRGDWNDLAADGTCGDQAFFGTRNFGLICEWDAKPRGHRRTVAPAIPKDAIEYNGHHYYVYSDVCSTWEEAERYCESLGGHLAVINDENENRMLYDLMKMYGHDSAYFGLTDTGHEGTWHWVNGDPISYTNWNQGEPNNERRLEHYGMFYWKFRYTWNDGDFGHGTNRGGMAFICEWDNNDSNAQGSGYGNGGNSQEAEIGNQMPESQPGSGVAPTSSIPDILDAAKEYEGHYYKIFAAPMNWKDANDFCKSMGGHLATAETQAENEMMKQMFLAHEGGSRCWIGGTRGEKNVWRWVTGKIIANYFDWARGEPRPASAVGGPSLCLSRNDKGKWDNVWSSDTYPFMCEWESLSDAHDSTW